MTRRNFLLGSAAFGSAPAFGWPRWLGGGESSPSGLRLRLGVISDIHVDAPKGDFMIFGDTTTFEATLRYFRSRGVDGVVIAGDMADCGMRNQLQCVADAWERVFPDDRGEWGRKVEKLFIFGNHDMEGCRNWGFDKRYAHKPSFFREVIATDPKKAWEDIFHEPYAPIWTKVVKGYRFVGAHWKPKHPEGVPEIDSWFAGHARDIDPSLPFFYIQHQHPRGTCHLDNAWGADNGLATRVLSRFPNAVAFSGHSHIPLTDPSALWQGAFTSVGCGSLRFAGGMFPLAPAGENGWENAREDGLMPKYEGVWESRQGMLLDVYDDRLVFERRDFLHDAELLGDDWVVPGLSSKEGVRECSCASRMAKAAAPEFPDGAKITLEERDGMSPKTRTRTPEKERQLVVKFPAAVGADDLSRVFDYEVAVDCIEADVKLRMATKRVYQPGAHKNVRRAAEAPSCVFGMCELPEATFHISVTPMNSFGMRGKPLVLKHSRKA